MGNIVMLEKRRKGNKHRCDRLSQKGMGGQRLFCGALSGQSKPRADRAEPHPSVIYVKHGKPLIPYLR